MTVQEFIGSLFEIEVNAHIAHLQTTSYAEHKALDSLYKDIVDLRDGFIESYQGQFGIIEGYPQIKVQEFTSIVSYLTVKANAFRKYRSELTEGYLQNQVDTINELLFSTLYKLKNLS